MARKQGSHSEITGPRVREAALRLIARDGFAAVSMRQIAAEVGVQAGALYNYIADKQSLLFDLLDDHMTQLLAAVEAAQIAGDPPRRLDRFVRFHIRYHLPRRDEVFLSYMELRNLTPENFARIEARRRAYEQVLQTILQAGVARGDFEVADTRVATRALIALLTGITNWYDPAGKLSVDEIEAIYCDLVRRSVTAPLADCGAQAS